LYASAWAVVFASVVSCFYFVVLAPGCFGAFFVYINQPDGLREEGEPEIGLCAEWDFPFWGKWEVPSKCRNGVLSSRGVFPPYGLWSPTRISGKAGDRS